MFQKICQIASLLSLFLTLSMLGGSYYAYRFVTSEQFKARVMNEVLDNVQGIKPKVLDNALPDMTGGTIPEYINLKISESFYIAFFVFYLVLRDIFLCHYLVLN